MEVAVQLHAPAVLTEGRKKLQYAPNSRLDGLHSLFGRSKEFKMTQISSIYRKSNRDSSVVQFVTLKLDPPLYAVV